METYFQLFILALVGLYQTFRHSKRSLLKNKFTSFCHKCMKCSTTSFGQLRHQKKLAFVRATRTPEQKGNWKSVKFIYSRRFLEIKGAFEMRFPNKCKRYEYLWIIGNAKLTHMITWTSYESWALVWTEKLNLKWAVLAIFHWIRCAALFGSSLIFINKICNENEQRRTLSAVHLTGLNERSVLNKWAADKQGAHRTQRRSIRLNRIN